MTFIVLETHGGAEYAAVCTDQDGNNLVFDNREDAEKEAADCQAAVIMFWCELDIQNPGF